LCFYLAVVVAVEVDEAGKKKIWKKFMSESRAKQAAPCYQHDFYKVAVVNGETPGGQSNWVTSLRD
jgi:hypothetical protein